MSITLKEILTEAGYNFEDLGDLRDMSQLLLEADDLGEEIDNEIERIEQEIYEQDERDEWYELNRARRGEY